jgi:UDP-GlcNAc:undecaprenyl-phosphate/decaprenyl-phosphate GlcNAc-1-phosphate transferase
MSFYFFYFCKIIFLIILFHNSKKIASITGLYKNNFDTTPLVGGLGIYFFFLLGTININYLDNNLIVQNISLLIVMSFIFLIGLLDDILNIDYKARLILFFVILTIFMKLNNIYLIDDLYFETFNKTFILGNISFFITPLFIMLLINSMNMADGINGIACLMFLSFLFIFFNHSNQLNIFLTFIVIALIIFLYFNLKNKIYLGDSGVYFISSFLSFYVINEYKFGSLGLSCEKIFLIFMIPGIDMFRLFCIRLYNKKNPFKGDLNHFHHLLINKFNIKNSLLIYISLIIWPNILNRFYGFETYLLIILNFVIYYLLINYLKKSKVS